MFKKIGAIYNKDHEEWYEQFEADTEHDINDIPACNPGSTVFVRSVGKTYTVGSDGAWIFGGGLPSGGTPYQQLVTDGDGNAKWEDRLAYSETIEWDGNAEGKEIIGGGLAILKKIPGITLEKVLEGTIEGTPISNIPFDFLAEGIYYFEGFYLVTQDNVFFNGVTFPYTGIYTTVRNQPFTMCIPIETIKNEYLPKNYRVVFWIKYNSTGSDSSIHCNCSYEELKSFCIGQSVPILGSLYDENAVKQLVYINYNENDATIYLQFFSSDGNIFKLNYKQDGSITRPAG